MTAYRGLFCWRIDGKMVPDTWRRYGSRLAVHLDEGPEGVPVNNVELAFLSPYATSKLKRFGNCQTQFDPEPLCAMSLPG